MESFAEVTFTDSSAATYSQVLFIDIRHSYPPSAPLTCRYTLTAPFQPNTRDWVGIYKVGWSTTKDYYTFVWVEPCLDVVGPEPVRKQAVFREYYLPKEDTDFYQFCYVDSSGQVRGASTPFCFKNPVEQSVDCSLENDLLVITTQEQVEQSVREKAELTKELEQMREEKESVKSALKEKQQEVHSLKEQNERREQERSELLRELSQTKEENESLTSTVKKQQREMDDLKEEVLVQMTNRMELQQNASEREKLSENTNSGDEILKQQEKYDGAVMEINQLKEERKELKRKIQVQSGEIAELKPKLREREQELLKLRDETQLLQVDVQSSEKEKERLSAEMRNLSHSFDDLKRENRELRSSLSELSETLLSVPDDDLKVQYQALLIQLQDARLQLANERQESNKMRRRGEQTERQLQDLQEQLTDVTAASDQTQRTSGKLELHLREAHGAIAEKDEIIEEKETMIMIEKQEKEELAEENQKLRRDIEVLRREFADLQAAPPAGSLPVPPSSPHGSPADTTLTNYQEDSPPESAQYENLYKGNAPETEEEFLVCRHCHESFPGITQEELVLHEQSHRVCPFCTLICDNMEQTVFEDHVYSHEL